MVVLVRAKSVCAPVTAVPTAGLHPRQHGFCRLGQARSLIKMTCAAGTNGLRRGQNDLRDLAKWFAQLAKWFAPHFENNGRPWENDLRVDLRLVCALICAWFAREGQRCL